MGDGHAHLFAQGVEGDFQYDIKELEVGAQLFDSYTLERID